MCSLSSSSSSFLVFFFFFFSFFYEEKDQKIFKNLFTHKNLVVVFS